jgi:hypothetical protein
MTEREAMQQARVAIAGGPRSGKTTLTDEIARERPGDPVIHTDDYMHLDWSEVSAAIVEDCSRLDRFILEGVRVPHALRKGLEADVVIWLGEARAERTPEQESMALACATVFDEWREDHPDAVVVDGVADRGRTTAGGRMKTAAQVIQEAGYEPHVRALMPFQVVRGTEYPSGEGNPAEGLARAGKGQREIVGIASEEGFAGDGIMLDPSGFPEAIGDWLRFGAIQSGHRLAPEHSVGLGLDGGWSAGVGMTIRAMISRAPDVESVWVKIDEGILRALSIGFFVLEGEWDDSIGELGAFRATRFVIPEVSIVRLPADPNALFEVSRSLRLPQGELRERMSDPALREVLLHGRSVEEPKKYRTVREAPQGHDVVEEFGAAAAVALMSSMQQRQRVQGLVRAVAERVHT